MYFLALVTDYDGTLANDGVVAPDTVAAIRRLKNLGRRLIVVTGRELPELQRAFAELARCNLIVAENGALLYEPGTGRETCSPRRRPSFYFRGPDGALSLRAQNLSLFLPIAAGVDDRTWLHHLRAEHYSAWIRDAIKDEDLADEFAAVEHDLQLSANDSRTRIKEAVDRRYTGPAAEAPGWGARQEQGEL